MYEFIAKNTGVPDLVHWQIPTQTDSGSPCSNMGIAFLVFFFGHAQDRPFLTKNWGNPDCAAADATAAATTTAATAASTATASISSSCHLLFSPCPPPSRLLVSSVVAPDPNDDDDDDDNDGAASTATTTTQHQRRRRPRRMYVASGIGRRIVPPSFCPPPIHHRWCRRRHLSPACKCVKRGLTTHTDIERLADVWLALSFQANFMFRSVL